MCAESVRNADDVEVYSRIWRDGRGQIAPYSEGVQRVCVYTFIDGRGEIRESLVPGVPGN